jgi:hypothetical protein
MEDLQTQLEVLLGMVENHNDTSTSYNKAQSKRIRTALGRLKKEVTDLRAGLIAQDKQN